MNTQGLESTLQGEEGETNLLRVVQNEAAEDRNATVGANVLQNRHRPDGHARHEHGSETGNDNDAQSGEKRSSDVQECLALRGRSDVAKTAWRGKSSQLLRFEKREKNAPRAPTV